MASYIPSTDGHYTRLLYTVSLHGDYTRLLYTASYIPSTNGHYTRLLYTASFTRWLYTATVHSSLYPVYGRSLTRGLYTAAIHGDYSPLLYMASYIPSMDGHYTRLLYTASCQRIGGAMAVDKCWLVVVWCCFWSLLGSKNQHKSQLSWAVVLCRTSFCYVPLREAATFCLPPRRIFSFLLPRPFDYLAMVHQWWS